MSRTDLIENAPGLEWRTRKSGIKVPIWTARRSLVANGYKPSTVNLSHLADDHASIAAQCRALQADMLKWAREQQHQLPRYRMDGTLGTLIDCYQTDIDSPYRGVSAATRKDYDESLQILKRNIGPKRLADIIGNDYRRWYRKFREPKLPGGKERTRRAYAAIRMLREVIRYGATLGDKACIGLVAHQSDIEFENVPARTVIITRAQVQAFISKAHEMGRPEMALAQAMQFELLLRQKDIIGEWESAQSGPVWSKGVLWSDIDEAGVLNKRTSKTGKLISFNLSSFPLVSKEIALVPLNARSGPMVIDIAAGRPFNRRHFADLWRKIARAAGIPDEVQNRDSRAGGITEASEAGVDMETLRRAATHSDPRTTMIYIRDDSLDHTERVIAARLKSSGGS